MREPRTPPLLRRLFSAAAVVCAVLLTTLPAPAQAPDPNPDPAPNYDSPQLCETLGGTLLPVGDANICQNLDATGTFCIIASRDAFPCRGLFKHVIRCHDYNRPAINPFICGPVCENGSPLGGTCRLPFADAVLVPGQPFTFTRNSASRTGVYHGQRRALHYIYFTAPNIFRQNRDRIHLVTHSDHAAHCALGNPEGKTSPWRVPTLAETAVLLADAPDDIAVVSDANPEGNPPPDTSFRLPLPPDSCAGQCAPPLANLSAASANAVQTANLLRPEILTPAPQPAPLAIQTEQSLSALRAAPPAFTRAPHQTRNPNLVFPCVASAVSGYQPPPLDSRVKITPSGAPVQTHAAPQIIHPSYAAPNAPDIPAAAPLLTVSAVAQRWTIIAENNLPTLAEHPVPVTVRADIGGNQQRLIATGKVVLPILAASAINARAPALIPVSVAASPEIGPVQTQIFHYANIPVETPPPVTAVVLASIVQIPRLHLRRRRNRHPRRRHPLIHRICGNKPPPRNVRRNRNRNPRRRLPPCPPMSNTSPTSQTSASSAADPSQPARSKSAPALPIPPCAATSPLPSSSDPSKPSPSPANSSPPENSNAEDSPSPRWKPSPCSPSPPPSPQPGWNSSNP